jgi:pSer/pThr/pTyr-binding forkhead associated (FHA) protein
MDKYNNEVALLVAQSGPLNGQRWALSHPLILGRGDNCDIIIPDRQVSRQHARLVLTEQGVLLEDLGSKNGTHLNGKLMNEGLLLQDGDSVQVALVQKFIFLSSDATVPLPLDHGSLETEASITNPQYSKSNLDEQTFAAERVGRLRLDKRSHRVWINVKAAPKGPAHSRHKSTIQEVEIDPPLSASQFRMLELLYDQEGRVVSRQDIIAGVWGLDEAIGVSEQALDALIRRLRDRLASVDPTHTYIITVRGHGLRLDNPLVQD